MELSVGKKELWILHNNKNKFRFFSSASIGFPPAQQVEFLYVPDFKLCDTVISSSIRFESIYIENEKKMKKKMTKATGRIELTVDHTQDHIPPRSHHISKCISLHLC